MVKIAKNSHDLAVIKSKEMERILEPGFSQANTKEDQSLSIRDLFRNYSKLYGVLRIVKQKLRYENNIESTMQRQKIINESHWAELCNYASKEKGIFCYSSGHVRTVLVPRDRVFSEEIPGQA